MKVFEVSPVVTLLRDELACYGVLLTAFDRQQDHLLHRRVDDTMAESACIEARAAEAAEQRRRREAWVQAFAQAHAQPADATLKQLLRFFPSEQAPLLEALIREINHLVHRLRRRARQNHGILDRAVELHQEVRQQLLAPQTSPRTYAPSGHVQDRHDTGGLRATG